MCSPLWYPRPDTWFTALCNCTSLFTSPMNPSPVLDTFQHRGAQATPGPALCDGVPAPELQGGEGLSTSHCPLGMREWCASTSTDV